MADPITMPPLSGCWCAFCTRRRRELQLASYLEQEMADVTMAEREADPGHFSNTEANRVRVERLLAEMVA